MKTYLVDITDTKSWFEVRHLNGVILARGMTAQGALQNAADDLGARLYSKCTLISNNLHDGNLEATSKRRHSLEWRR